MTRQCKEGLFFGAYFILSPMIIQIQFGRDPMLSGNPLWPAIIYRSICGLLNILPYYAFYRWVIPRFLFRKRYLAFTCCILIFWAGFDLYVRAADDYLVSRLWFLPSLVLTWARGAARDYSWLRVDVSGFFSDIIMVTGLAYYFHSRDQERQVNELKQQQLRLELEYLKAQMNPHFLFNTLNNIYSLAQERSVKTATMVARLSELMRYVLYDSDADKVPLSSEIGFVESYMDIERIRFPNRIDVRFDWQGSQDDLLIEPLLLIPFVENAFKHGIREELARGFVEVISLLEEGELTFQVCNSKSNTAPATKGGVGLRNVRKRLHLLYPDKHHLSISETADRYTISLTLQLTRCYAV